MRVPILHFSDVLCVYAYLAQVRIDELNKTFGAQIELDFHFCQVFGDTRLKIESGWADRGGLAGYNRHVLGVASRFEHARLHPELWTKNPPTGSLSPHLFIKAVAELEALELVPRNSSEAMAWAVRRAFFEEARDISDRAEQLRLAEAQSIERALLERVDSSGRAHAALARDLDLARKYEVSLSPTLIFNEGRQRLNGNVGFRIIEANVRELLREPQHEASWC